MTLVVCVVQERLANRLAELYMLDEGLRPALRVALTAVGRGGQGDAGQRIRDEILHVQARNGAKVIKHPMSCYNHLQPLDHSTGLAVTATCGVSPYTKLLICPSQCAVRTLLRKVCSAATWFKVQTDMTRRCTCCPRDQRWYVGCKESENLAVTCKGGMMEEWHQKLHNNTSPDDVVICEALIAHLESGLDVTEYWRKLEVCATA